MSGNGREEMENLYIQAKKGNEIRGERAKKAENSGNGDIVRLESRRFSNGHKFGKDRVCSGDRNDGRQRHKTQGETKVSKLGRDTFQHSPGLK